MIVAGDPVKPKRAIPFPYSEVKRLLGVDIPQSEGEAILARLGFELKDGKAIVPSWRPDIEGKADIVEQIVRIAGLDRVPPAPLPRANDGVPAPVLTPLQKRTRLAKRALVGAGPARGRDVVVHRQAGGATVRRRHARTGARQSDRRRSFRHAAEPGSGPRRRGRAQRATRPRRRRLVRGRADLPRRRRERPARRGGGGQARLRQGARRRPPLERRRAGRRL